MKTKTAIAAMMAAATIAAITSLRPEASVQSAAGFWVGSGHSKRFAEAQWVTATFTYRSSFWFTVGSNGVASGEALVTYELESDDSKLRSYLAVLNGVASAPLTILPGVGDLIGPAAQMKDVIGVRMAYDDAMPVVRAPVRGTLQGNKLHLEWGTAPSPLSYKWFRVHLTKEVVMRPQSAPAYTPWSVDADVAQTGATWRAMASGKRALQGLGQEVVTWSAVRSGN
jgi:hypothetical protein